MCQKIMKNISKQSLEKLHKHQVIITLKNNNIIKGEIVLFSYEIIVIKHLENKHFRTMLPLIYVKNIVVNKLYKELG